MTIIITINYGNWSFEADIYKTKEYYKNNIQCECLPCQNLRKQIKEAYTKLDEFLVQFGVDISRPEESIWSEADVIEQTVLYSLYYTVNGSILKFDEYEIDLDNINIVISNPDSTSINTDITEPYFIICVYNIYLPWKLEEDYFSIFPETNQKNINKMLNHIYTKSLDFGKNWRNPLEDIVKETYPKLSPEDQNKLSKRIGATRNKIESYFNDNYIYNNPENDKKLEESGRAFIKHNYPWMNKKNTNRAIYQAFYYAWHG